jgi:hypothetical protein
MYLRWSSRGSIVRVTLEKLPPEWRRIGRTVMPKDADCEPGGRPFAVGRRGSDQMFPQLQCLPGAVRLRPSLQQTLASVVALFDPLQAERTPEQGSTLKNAAPATVEAPGFFETAHKDRCRQARWSGWAVPIAFRAGRRCGWRRWSLLEELYGRCVHQEDMA